MASGKETHRASTGFDMCNNGLLGTTRDLAGISAYQTQEECKTHREL
jgi:hypothetical protein